MTTTQLTSSPTASPTTSPTAADLTVLDVSASSVTNAVRGWTSSISYGNRSPRQTTRRRKKPPVKGINDAGMVLVLDTETTVDSVQALTFGSYRVGTYAQGGVLTILEEGLFHADDLETRDPDGLDVLRRYAEKYPANVSDVLGARRTLRLLSRHDFMHTTFSQALKANALVVTFNKPFDLTRLAIDCGIARGGRHVEASPFFNGFSLKFSPYGQYNRIRLKGRNSTSAFTELASAGPQARFKGKTARLLDLRTLGFALRATKYTLAAACSEWKVEHAKTTAEEHGRITPDYVAYNLRDTQATTELLAAMLADLEQHPIDARPETLMSSASLGKKYLEAMGVAPRLGTVKAPGLQPDFDPVVLGYATSAFYGGRSECRLRRVSMPVQVHDFTSMYPTVYVLMGLWSLLTAQTVETVDATDDVRSLLSTVDLEAMFRRESWGTHLVTLVEVAPDADVLPVRTRYSRANGAARSIGVNYTSSRTPVWYALPDVIASQLITGKTPRILRAVRLVGEGQQQTLTPVNFYGKVRVDPRTQDVYKAAIEQRALVKKQPEGYALKIFANATSYGVNAEMNPQDLKPSSKATATVYDGHGDPVLVSTEHPEEPGNYTFPPIAAVITAAARLMLTMLERCVTDRGGCWVFADTDSLAVVATEHGGMLPCEGGYAEDNGRPSVHALSHEDTAQIRDRFQSLCPYDWPDGVAEDERAMLKLEYTGWCYAVSAKRYACFSVVDTADGRRVMVDPDKTSEHGLGYLIDPSGDDDPWTDEPALQLAANQRGKARPWVRRLWEAIIAADVHTDPTRVTESPELLRLVVPNWFDRPAVGRVTVTSQEVLAHFDRFNDGKEYRDRIKPANFLLVASERLIDTGRLVAPYEPDPAKWSDLDWYRTRSGKYVSEGTETLGLQQLRHVAADYFRRPEAKFADGDGRPCEVDTRGWLRRRHVVLDARESIGKEANRLEERAEGLLQADPTHVYRSAPRLWDHAWRVLADRGSTVVGPLAPDVTRRQVERYLTGAHPPRAVRDELIGHALRWALDDLRRVLPGHSWADDRDVDVLAAWGRHQEAGAFARACACGCGAAVAGRSRWAGEACRKRVARAAGREVAMT